MRGDNRIKIPASHRVVDSGTRCRPRVIARRDVSWIIRITWELVRQLEDFLSVVNKLLRTMRLVECDEIRQRPQVCLAQRLQIIGDLSPEFIEKRGEPSGCSLSDSSNPWVEN